MIGALIGLLLIAAGMLCCLVGAAIDIDRGRAKNFSEVVRKARCLGC